MGEPSFATLKVLRALLDDPGGEHYGLGLIRETGVQAGALYPILNRLERDGWVTSSWEDIDEQKEGRRRRKYYRLTAQGARAAHSTLIDAVARITPRPGRRRPLRPRPAG